MYSISQKLFETYSEAVLREQNRGFDEEAVIKWLRGLSLDEKTIYWVADGLFDYYSFRTERPEGISAMFCGCRRLRRRARRLQSNV